MMGTEQEHNEAIKFVVCIQVGIMLAEGFLLSYWQADEKSKVDPSCKKSRYFYKR